RGVRVVALAPASQAAANRGVGVVRMTDGAVAVGIVGTPGAESAGGAAAVTLRIRGRDVGHALAARGSTVSISLPPLGPGWWVGELVLEPDELRADDRRLLVWRVAPPARVAVLRGVEGGPFVAAALAVLEEGRRVRGEGRPEVVIGDRPEAGAMVSIVVPPAAPALVGQANRALAVRHGRHARPDRRARSADNRGAAGDAEVLHRDGDWGRRTGDQCGHHGPGHGERRAVARAGRRRPAARQPARHGLDRAARGARVRPVPGRAGEPGGPGGGTDLRGGRRPGRGVPDARRRHRRRDRVRARPARVGSHAGVSGARARRAGRGRARRRGVCRSAVRRSRAPRRQRAAAGAGGALCAGGAGRRDAHPLMPLDFVIDRLDALPATRALAEGLPASGARQGIAGLPGSSPAVLVAALARRLPQRVFVVVTPTPTDAERWLADLRTLTGTAVLYPQ